MLPFSKQKQTQRLGNTSWVLAEKWLHCSEKSIQKVKIPSALLVLGAQSFSCFPDAASKHATQAFFDCLRAEVEQYDIEVTVVSPGYIQTNLSLNAVTADGSRYGGETPLTALFLQHLPVIVRYVCNTWPLVGTQVSPEGSKNNFGCRVGTASPKIEPSQTATILRGQP